FHADAAAKMFYDPANGPKQAIPDSVLLPSTTLGANEPIHGLSALLQDDEPNDDSLGQADLRFLSLKGNVIDDVRPLTQLANLEVVRLDDNLIGNIQDLAGERLVDNNDPAFRTLGDWLANQQPTDAAFEGDYVFRNGTDDTTQASWTFTQLDPGVYQVLMTYVPGQAHSDDVTVVVKGADTASVVNGLSLFGSLPSATPPPPAGGPLVTINTDRVGFSDMITGDDGNTATFYGTPYTSSITVDGMAQITVYGDLNIPADLVRVIGSRPLSLVVGNNVT